jgi:hypothetical protein
MKRVLPVLFISYFLLYAVALADQPEIIQEEKNCIFTDGSLNGNGWITMDQAQKSIYIAAFRDGIDFCSELDFVVEGVEKEKIKAVIESLKYYKFNSSNVDLVRYFDIFYSNPINLNIPLPNVYIVMFTHYKGYITDHQRDDYVRYLRKKYNQ